MRKIFALGLAAALATGVGAPAAMAAAPVTPAQVAGETPLATIKQIPANHPIRKGQAGNNPDAWRAAIDASPHGHRVDELWAYSPSMNRDIPVAVIRATNPDGSYKVGAPTIYALNGAGGAEQGMDWLSSSDIMEFYLDKGVNVVIPMQGAFSYYIDWYRDGNGAYNLTGPQRWETFLLHELPGPLESYIQAGDKRGVLGFSMSATSALLLAQHAPGFYDAVGSFSGCAATSTFLPYNFAKITMNRANANVEDAFGPMGSPHNLYNDALVNAEKLRGTEIYVSNASGLAGRTDQTSWITEQLVQAGLEVPAAQIAGSANSATLQVEGGVIEAATNACTHDLNAKLKSLNIPATFNFRNTGTHSWPYWNQDIVDSWPTFERAFFG